jgi:hypothetical protein
MKTACFPAAIAALALALPPALHAQGTAPTGAAPMTDAASGAKVKKAPRARVTGGPGYVSESGAPASAASASGTKHRARVTGGPGGTAPSPKSGG